MCTITFIPVTGSEYILTSSRDEQTTRPSATGPEISKFGSHTLIYPKDPKGGGTWIACDNTGKTACLFNGAFYAHVPKYPYRHSRGLIVLDFFRFSDIQSFSEKYDLDNIEPFTLLIIQNRTLVEFKWDGERSYLLNHDFTLPRIWSSVTLYDREIIKSRELWFNEWLKTNQLSKQKDLIKFHLKAGDGRKETNVLMERKEFSLRTVSITSVVVLKDKIQMEYLDLINNKTTAKELEYKYQPL
jgi:hypothetical protein